MAASSSPSSSPQASPRRAAPRAPQLPLPVQDDPWPTLLAAALAIDVTLLRQFILAMAERGDPVDSARMFLDPVYAFRRLAAAHAGSDEALRSLSLKLFEPCQQFEERRRQNGIVRLHQH
jgi:hypothetical protein